jgi:tyrosine-protein phosphatase SIW14
MEGAETLAIPVPLRWAFGLALAALVILVPILRYRAVYDHGRRLREVDAGILYRSGCLTAGGFADAVQQLGIKTIVNLQDEFPDPQVRRSYLDTRTTSEIEMCQRLGVRYVYLPPDLVSRQKTGSDQPRAIAQFLAIMDDPVNYPRPVLIHCKAGLHRTGVMVAVYRMEYQGWSPEAALAELKANGFGEFVASTANEYVAQYVTTYKPRQSATVPTPQPENQQN